jgi:hypothetical protein
VSRFGSLINAGFGRCKHRVLGTCVDAADGCCAGVACAICVKLLDGYGEVVDGASFAWDGTGYSGTVGGFSFESYWENNYGDCEFHVIISAGGYIEPIHIIKTKGDYTDAACCMNPGGETEVDDGTDTYTMTWGPVDPLILARRLVSEGCHERFCGDCDCAPRKLCLQVSSDDCNVTEIIGLEENYADPDCPLPVWPIDFTCGAFSFSGQLALVRDEYTGGCILQMSGTRGGEYDEESQDYAVTDCAALSASFTLTEDYVDYIITISPADCDACGGVVIPCCDMPNTGYFGCFGLNFTDSCWVERSGSFSASTTLLAENWSGFEDHCSSFVSTVINFGASIPGCGGASINYQFLVIQVDDSTQVPAELIGIVEDYDWIVEVFADGAYVGRSLVYSAECTGGPPSWTFNWVTFPEVPLAAGTLTMTMFKNPGDFCA